jgi:NADPH2:quinone reductase
MPGLCENPVGVDALQWKELPTPQPKAGEVLVAIKAASLNFPDLLIVQNKYQHKPPLPFVPGSEYAGVVEGGRRRRHAPEGGPGVACLSGTGGFGTHTSRRRRCACRCPRASPSWTRRPSS